MKKITLQRIVDFAGLPLNAKDGELAMIDIICSCLARMDVDGATAIRAFALGGKITGHSDAIEVEDAEHDLIRAALEHNGPKYIAIVLAQVLQCVLDAEDPDVGTCKS